jgi:DNA-binding MarR family transcriptional regulator
MISVIGSYLEVIALIEHVRYVFRCRFKGSIDRLKLPDISPLEILLLMHAADKKTPVPVIRNRINYKGCHLSYLIRKLTEQGYLSHERAPEDHRVVNIGLTNKGRELYERITEVLNCRIAAELTDNPAVERAMATLRQIEQFWIDQVLDREQHN